MSSLVRVRSLPDTGLPMKPAWRSVTATLLGGLLVAVMGGCGDSGHAPRDRRQRTQLVAVIKALDNPYFVAMRAGLIEEASALGVPLRVSAPPNSLDSADQAAELEAYLSPPVSCYIINPINSDNLIQPLAELPAHTPIVNVDNPIDIPAASSEGVHISTFIGTDDYAAGAAAADAIGSRVNRGADVAVLEGPPGDVPSGQRVSGFTDAIRGRFTVVQTVAADFEQSRARLATAQLLRVYPHLRGVFAGDDLMALGADQAVRAARRRVVVVGVDGIPPAVVSVERGAQTATVSQFPYTEGQLAVLACLVAIKGEHLPANIATPVAVITRRTAARALARFPLPVNPVTDLPALIRK
jgi:ribose transport system substrate-binding protein